MKTTGLPKARACAYCGANAGSAVFCGTCYGLLDGGTKQRIRAQFKLGAPRTALRTGIAVLDGLRASGVPVPAKKERTVAG